MITALNRNAIVVRPTRKLNEWMRSLNGSEICETDDEPTVYLVTEQDAEDESSALENHWRKIADAEFESWWVDERDWPKILNLQEFLEYFVCLYSEIVHDISPKRLVREKF